MENLNKQQVILIALLVAIVTSITTGIVTVSLYDQTPGGASQTIYNVVERTIEKVIPSESPIKKIIEKEKPVEVSQVPLTDIADKTGKNMIRIFKKDALGVSQFVSLAVAVGSKGALLSAGNSNSIAEGETISAQLSDGTSFEVTVQKKNIIKGIDILLIKDSNNFSKTVSVTLGNFSNLKLGSNVIAFGGKEKDDIVSTGIITQFENLSEGQATTSKDVAVSNMILSTPISGWLLLDTSGKIIGISLPEEADKMARFVDVDIVRKSLGDKI